MSFSVQVKHEGWTCSLGVFPVSIKNEEFLAFVNDPSIQEIAHNIREQASAYLSAIKQLSFVS